ncbi:MAG: hypothetical protein U9R79_16635 [Armatimonadota bacterium]|nr:hypothetical protein [Armatimonadota bacterium]
MAVEVALATLAVALFPAIGWISLRYLRAAPDFPHKQEMVWGAKWGGVIYGLLAVLPATASLLMWRHEVPWHLTVQCAGGVLTGLLLAAGILSFWPVAGMGSVFSVVARRPAAENMCWRQHVERLEEGRGNWLHKLLLAGAVGVVLFWGYLTFGLVQLDMLFSAAR